jgi:hypothetical protein
MRIAIVSLVSLLMLWVASAGAVPDDAKAANARGMKAYRAKDYAGAAKEFRAALAIDAKYVLAHYNLASMAALMHDMPTVLAELRWLHDSSDPEAKKALQKAPTDPDLKDVVGDPEVKKLIGGGCDATCEAEGASCFDNCDKSRGCIKMCTWAEDDCHAACAVGMDAGARARMRAWIDGPLSGNDNDMAKMRDASITRADNETGGYQGGGYEVFIKNQFGFRCVVEFGGDGAPSRLSGCKASEEGWSAKPDTIPLKCRLDKKHKADHCEGGFHLLKDGIDQEGLFTVERALK